jgi:4-amino-4-deoxy-L-arabinose transferase-like glycosyltransferase
VGACCLLFFFISIYQLDLPGLYTDEAFDVIPAMQMVKGHPVELLDDVLNLGGLRLPLMSSSAYQGVTYTYLALPFFALGGVNVFSLRLMTVLVGVVGVVLAYFLGKAWFGRNAGLLAALLLALSPSWIFWSRVGVYVVSVVAPLAAGALLAFTYWVRRRPLGARNGPLYLGMFLMGVGLSTKLLFLWFILAVAITALILWGRPMWEARQAVLRAWTRWLRVSALAGLSFVLGAFPFLLYNLLTRGTVNLIRQTLADPTVTTHGTDNTAFMRNLWTEVDAFKVLLDGGYFWFQGWKGQPHANPLMPSLFALSAIGLLALVLIRRGKPLVQLTRLSQVSMIVLGSALTLATLLAIGVFGDRVQGWVALPLLLIVVAGIVLAVIAAARDRAQSVPVAWALFFVTVAAGAIWWFGGAGRPDRAALNSFLGLWPIDLMGVLFWVSGAALMLLLGLDPSPAPRQRATVAALSLIGLVVAQSTVTVSGLWSTHLVIIMPLPQLVIAAFAVELTRQVGEWLSPVGADRRLALLRALPAVLILVPVLLLEGAVTYAYHSDLTRTGGATTFSSAIYDLRDYLETEHAGKEIVAMDWGFRRPLQFLSNERIVPIEGYGLSKAPPEEFYHTLREWLKDHNVVYIFHTRDATAYPRHEDFREQARLAGKQVELARTFYQRDGIPVYEVYVVR